MVSCEYSKIQMAQALNLETKICISLSVEMTLPLYRTGRAFWV